MKNYPGENNSVNYEEGILVGYRYYDTKKITPLFPFGHGLSYTKFEYSNLNLKKSGNKIVANFEVKNIGKDDGAEVTQLYIRDLESQEIRPLKELRNFEKVFLHAGEKKEIKFNISTDDLAYFSESKNEWIVERGDYEVLIGSSSADIRLKKKFAY